MSCYLFVALRDSTTHVLYASPVLELELDTTGMQDNAIAMLGLAMSVSRRVREEFGYDHRGGSHTSGFRACKSQATVAKARVNFMRYVHTQGGWTVREVAMLTVREQRERDRVRAEQEAAREQARLRSAPRCWVYYFAFGHMFSAETSNLVFGYPTQAPANAAGNRPDPDAAWEAVSAWEATVVSRLHWTPGLRSGFNPVDRCATRQEADAIRQEQFAFWRDHGWHMYDLR